LVVLYTFLGIWQPIAKVFPPIERVVLDGNCNIGGTLLNLGLLVKMFGTAQVRTNDGNIFSFYIHCSEKVFLPAEN
jgi:hypothetical protein